MSLKILVANDELASMKTVRALAVSAGHIVVTCESQADATERAGLQRFDVVFLGMNLPDLSGLELAREIRAAEANKEAAIVMLSSEEDVESLRKAFGEGADFVLTKPVAASQILAMLAAMQSPGWKGKRHAARMPLFTEVICRHGEQEHVLRSMNISSSGMLLQPSVEIEIGEQVSLEFSIPEVQATLGVAARVARKEETDRVAMAFVDLAPEAINAIQLYVMGRLSNTKGSALHANSGGNWVGPGALGEH